MSIVVDFITCLGTSYLDRAKLNVLKSCQCSIYKRTSLLHLSSTCIQTLRRRNSSIYFVCVFFIRVRVNPSTLPDVGLFLSTSCRSSSYGLRFREYTTRCLGQSNVFHRQTRFLYLVSGIHLGSSMYASSPFSKFRWARNFLSKSALLQC